MKYHIKSKLSPKCEVKSKIPETQEAKESLEKSGMHITDMTY